MMQMNWSVAASYAKGIWAPVGPLIGVLVGAYIANRNQRKQWIADNEVKEWRELLTTIVTSFQAIVRNDKLLPSIPGEEIESLKESARARMVANEVLVNRIFIAKEVRKDSLYQRWSKALEQFDQDHDPATFGTAFGELNALILKGARAHIGKV